MKLLTDLKIQTTSINFKTDHTKTDYKYFKVIERIGWVKKNNKKYPVYKAICKACNTVVAIPSPYFTDNKSVKSCGCSRSKIRCKNNPGLQRLFLKYKTRGNFDLSIESFEDLTTSNCYYCNNAPNQKSLSKTGVIYYYNGLDRINPKKDYTIDNVVPCCRTCNFMKGTLSQDTFLLKISQIHTFAPGLDKFGKFDESLNKKDNVEPSSNLKD